MGLYSYTRQPPPYRWSHSSLVSTTTPGTGAAVPWPTHRIGDVMVVVVNTQRSAVVEVIANATGWVEAPGSPQSVDAGTSATADHRTTVFICRATSAAMPTPTFGMTSGASDYMLARGVVIRGVSEAGTVLDAINVSLAEQNTNGLNTFTWASVTTTVDDCLLIFICGTGEATIATGTPVNANLWDLQEASENGTTDGDDGSFYLAHGVMQDAGATGATVATPSIGSRAQSRFTIALMPPQVEVPDPGDLVAPTVTRIAPVDGVLGANTSIVVDVEDNLEISIAAVLARYPSGRLEVVHDGAGKGPHYTAAPNAREVLDDGLRHRFTILRDGGWSVRGGRPRLEFIVRDAAGNVAVIS